MTEQSHDLKSRFKSNYKIDLQVARCGAALYIESLDLSTLNPDQKVRKLKKEYDHSNQEIDTFPRKEYLKFGPSETRHFNVFLSHYIFDHCEEESELLKGLITSEKNKQLMHVFKKSKTNLAPFNLRGFLKGYYNIVFYEFNQKPPGTSEEDYFKMRSWQIMRKQDCVNLLLNQFIKRFFEQADHQGSIDDQARAELKLLEEVCNPHRYTPEQFMSKFMQLKAVDPLCLPGNTTEFHQLIDQFHKGHDFSPLLSPPMLRSALKQVRSGKLSPVPLCCWTLIKYKKWLTCLLEKKIDLKDPQGPFCAQLFEQNYQLALELIQGLIAEFKEKYLSGVISGEKYKVAIWAEIDKYRLKYNQLSCLDYFLFLPDIKMAKSYFINNCLLDIDMENQGFELRTTIVINGMGEFFRNELCQTDQSWIEPLGNMKEFKNNCVDLFNSMILNPKQMDQLWWAFKRTLQALSANKPILFIVEDLKKSIHIIFNKALKGLYKLLDQQPGNLIAIYAIQEIKYLELRAIEAQGNDLNLNEYFDKVKNVFKVHLDFVENMEKRPSPEMDSPSDKSPIHECPTSGNPSPGFKTDTNTVSAFHYKEVKNDGIPAVTKTLIHLGALPDDTTVPEVRELVNGQECQHPLRWLAGLGDLMVFTKELANNGKLTFPYQQQWNIAVKCFVQADGSNFNVNSLKVALPTSKAGKFIKAARQL